MAVLLNRGLWGGIGISQLYVDPGLFPQRLLLEQVCARQDSVISTINLGTPILYPSSWIFCGATRGALAAGVPAWMIARLLPLVLQVIAAYGMASLLHSWSEPEGFLMRPRRISRDIGCTLCGLAYAFNPYTFNEIAASHIYYLIAIAVFPYAARLLRKPGAARCLGAGGLLALAFSQLQFMILAPLALVLVLAGSRTRFREVLRTVALTTLVGFAFELPWVVPYLMYRPPVNVNAYLVPEVALKFSVVPVDAIRLLGYPLHLFETGLGPAKYVWSWAAFALVAGAAVALVRLSRRSLPITVLYLLVIVATLVYSWGARGAPLFSIWNKGLPVAVQGVLRERYSVLFLIVVVFVMAHYHLAYSDTSSAMRGVGLAGIILLAGMWSYPFLNGHASVFGARRYSYEAQEAVAHWLRPRVAKNDATLSLPAGSIVRGPGWPQFGRNPFPLGGPGSPLDVESLPSTAQAAIEDLVQRIAHGCQWLTNAQQLRVSYAVWWTDLQSDRSEDDPALFNNMQKCGFQPVFSVPGAMVLKAPYERTSSYQVLPALAITTDPTLVAGDSETASLTTASPSEAALRLAAVGGPKLFVPYRRQVIAVRRSDRITILQPIYRAQDGRLARKVLEQTADVPAGTDVVFGDGSALPREGTVLVSDVTGTAQQLYLGPVRRLNLGPQFGQAAKGAFQAASADRAKATASFAATSRRIVVSAASGVAGVPFELPVIAGAKYEVSASIIPGAGPSPYVSIVFDGEQVATTLALGKYEKQQTLIVAAAAPSVLHSAYAVVYQPAAADGLGTSTIEGATARVGIAAGPELASLSDARVVPVSQADRLTVPVANQYSLLSTTTVSSGSHAHEVQDVENRNRVSLSRAGISAVPCPASPSNCVTLQAATDVAGIPVPFQASSGERVNVTARYSGRVGGRPQIGFVSTKGSTLQVTSANDNGASGTLEASFVVPPGESLGYIYLREPAVGPSKVTFLQTTAQLFGPVASLVPWSMSDEGSGTASGPARFVRFNIQPEPGYRLTDARGHRLPEVPAYDHPVGQFWYLMRPSNSFRLSYAPERVFRSLVLAVLVIYALGFLWASTRSIHRSRLWDDATPRSLDEDTKSPEETQVHA